MYQKLVERLYLSISHKTRHSICGNYNKTIYAQAQKNVEDFKLHEGIEIVEDIVEDVTLIN